MHVWTGRRGMLAPMPSSLPYTQVVAVTRQGRTHETNDDRFGLLDPRVESVRRARRGVLYAVADGVSSSVAGSEAAQLCIESLQDFFTANRTPTEDLLLDIVERADAEVRLTTGSACTLVGVWLCHGVATIFSVGDSSAVLVRDGAARRMNPLQRRGGGLAAFVGMGPGVRASVFLESLPMQLNDRFWLGSDGAFDLVDEAWLARSCPVAESMDMIRPRFDGQHDDDATLVGIEVLALESNPWQERAMQDA
jgi:serine/threonine protein phosphatase PrpC